MSIKVDIDKVNGYAALKARTNLYKKVHIRDGYGYVSDGYMGMRIKIPDGILETKDASGIVENHVFRNALEYDMKLVIASPLGNDQVVRIVERYINECNNVKMTISLDAHALYRLSKALKSDRVTIEVPNKSVSVVEIIDEGSQFSIYCAENVVKVRDYDDQELPDVIFMTLRNSKIPRKVQ